MVKLPSLTAISRRLTTNASYIGKYLYNFGEKRLKNPVFIIGCPRSGTTMLMRNISSHPDIATFSTEANHLWHPKSYPWQYSDLRKPPPWVDPRRFSEMSLDDWTQRDIKNIKNIFGTYQTLTRKMVFINRSAMITFFISFLIDTFPNPRLIHIFRDGRAVAFSYAKMEYPRIIKNPEPFREKGYFFSFNEILDACSETWKEHMFEIEKKKKELNLEQQGILYELSYEKYCMNPRKHLIQIADFLHLDPYKFRMKDYSEIKSMNFKYRKELHKKDIKRISRIMEPALMVKGYSISS